MRSIQVSEAVWQEIAKRGNFGETEDDVLRRVFDLPPTSEGIPSPMPDPKEQQVSSGSGRSARRGRRSSYATRRLSSYINGGMLHVEFAGGPRHSWPLPGRNDKVAIRLMRDDAVEFVRRHGATLGQQNAVKKTLTDSGYHLVK